MWQWTAYGCYFPPLGGFLYFLRPGTTKLALWPKLPIVGGTRRSWLDVALYLALIVALVRALIAADIEISMLIPIAILAPLLAIVDRTIFLALRAEHYWTTTVCFLFAGNWIAGAKAVQLALWFWAGFSKLNHHFPAVVCVMTSNSPFTPFAALRTAHVSRLSRRLAACGAGRRPFSPGHRARSDRAAGLFAFARWLVAVAGHCADAVAARVRFEQRADGRADRVEPDGRLRRFRVILAHPDVAVWSLDSVPLAVFLAVMLIVLPVVGNLFPRRVSFLVAMRYYAGNWPFGVWLFRGESYRKLERLTKSAPWIQDQLAHFYDPSTSAGLIGKVMGFRLMHLHGRALAELLPQSVERLEDYEYLDGELVAGMVLGWNFGDGHLHDEQLLNAVQEQCQFDEDELRCIFVESQPLGRQTLAYRILDAKRGLLRHGALDVKTLRQRQPWGPA